MQVSIRQTYSTSLSLTCARICLLVSTFTTIFHLYMQLAPLWCKTRLQEEPLEFSNPGTSCFGAYLVQCVLDAVELVIRIPRW